jgi:hypothetical protein
MLRKKTFVRIPVSFSTWRRQRILLRDRKGRRLFIYGCKCGSDSIWTFPSIIIFSYTLLENDEDEVLRFTFNDWFWRHWIWHLIYRCAANISWVSARSASITWWFITDRTLFAFPIVFPYDSCMCTCFNLKIRDSIWAFYLFKARNIDILLMC